MKPCPDCQCKNPDTATTCGWCARDVTDVAIIPGPGPARVREKLAPLLTEGRAAAIFWILCCIYLVTLASGSSDSILLLVIASAFRGMVSSHQILPANILKRLGTIFRASCIATIILVLLITDTKAQRDCLYASYFGLILAFLLPLDIIYFLRKRNKPTP